MDAMTAITRERFPEENEHRFEALDGDTTIGYANVIDLGHKVWIAELRVDPAHRGRGIARSLLAAVIAVNGDRDMALSPYPFERGMPAEDLVAWYGRHGFRPAGEDGTRMHRPAQEARS